MPRYFCPILFLFFLILIFTITLQQNNKWVSLDAPPRITHQPTEIPEHKIAHVSQMSDVNHLQNTINRILVPRIVGTPGHDEVRNFISDSMRQLNWNIESDKFQENTPNMGRQTFENIIATLNPNAERYLVLACHYDSKYIPNEVFLGATDSAVPCGMLINTAHVMKDQLSKIKTNNDLSLMFIFFDGEEAFLEWGPTDSIYGARHLANKWSQENKLNQIDLLMLLDLIGMPDPKFYSFFKDTERWYAQLLHSEERLAYAGYLEKYTASSAMKSLPNRYFQPRSANSYVEDDHIPFLHLGVPIIHMIPIPFPEVWHKNTDNHEIIDYSTVENINHILRLFILEYLKIDI